jgi:uncharacterized membrane protein
MQANPIPTPGELESAESNFRRVLSSWEFVLSCEVIVFGMVIVLVEFLLLRNRNTAAEDILKVFAVTLVIIGTLFAIVAGFDSRQIAPAMGLFGTITGYILGRTAQTRKEGPQQTDGKDETNLTKGEESTT